MDRMSPRTADTTTKVSTASRVSSQCLGYMSYKASFCLENYCHIIFIQTSPKRRQKQKKCQWVWSYLFASQGDASASKNTWARLDTLSSIPRVHCGGKVGSLKVVLTTPPRSTMACTTYTQIGAHHMKMNTHTIINVLKYIYGAVDRTQDPVAC